MNYGGSKIVSCKRGLLLGSFVMGAAHAVACGSVLLPCEERKCGAGGLSGVGGDAHGGTAESTNAGAGGSSAGTDQGGNAGIDVQGGEAGIAGEGGSGGAASDLAIAPPLLEIGKTYRPYTGEISASGAAHYAWSIASGTLPAGLSLHGVQTDTVTISGIPTEAGPFPISLSVTDGSSTITVDVTLFITHPALFISERNPPELGELYLAELGASSATEPVRVNAALSSDGKVESFQWSPDGSKILYTARQASTGSPAELWIASLDSPGSAQLVSATVSSWTWLRAGSVAAYSTASNETYLVDLSGPAPWTSKLLFPAFTGGVRLLPSPNGVSLVVVSTPPPLASIEQNSRLDYVTWSAGAPTSVSIASSIYLPSLTFSHDGRFMTLASNGGADPRWLDLTLPAPAGNALSVAALSDLAWSPKAEGLLYAATTSTSERRVRLGTFDGGSLTSTELSIPCNMPASPWSPDGENAIFTCSNDLRAISNLTTAAAGAEFSLLPNSFLDARNEFVSWSPDSQWVALTSNHESSAVSAELFLIRWSAPGMAYGLHTTAVAQPGASEAIFSPNSQTIAFAINSAAPLPNSTLYVCKLPSSGAPPAPTFVASDLGYRPTGINWLPGSRMIVFQRIVPSSPSSANFVAQVFAAPVAVDGTPGRPLLVGGAKGKSVISYELAPIH